MTGTISVSNAGEKVTPGRRTPRGPHIEFGLPFVRGEWQVPAALLRKSTILKPGEYDAREFFGSNDFLRGRVNVIESRSASGINGRTTESVARFVSVGPMTTGIECPVGLRQLIEEAVPRTV